MVEGRGFLRRALETLLRSATSPEPEDSFEASGAGRRWRLLQIESSLDCGLECVMCPWHDVRKGMTHEGLLPEDVWQAIVRHLPEVAEIDFSGGGEPLLQPRLVDWVAEAHAAGTRVGFLTNAVHLVPETSGALLDAGLDWLACSIDGATAETYEAIRINSSFEVICENLRQLIAQRQGARPHTMVNFVLMKKNRDELVPMVELVADLGLDRLNIKQADVIRGERGKGAGLFAREETAAIRVLQEETSRAAERGKALGLEVEVFPFTAREQPVCAQQPDRTMFVRHDGVVSACISLAYGGPTTFFGEPAEMPTVAYGRLPDDDLLAIWEGEASRRIRDNFGARTRAYQDALGEGLASSSPAALQKAIQRGLEAMPEACPGCRNCHYLYGV